MPRPARCRSLTTLLALALVAPALTRPPVAAALDGDFVMRDVHFHSGETLPELRIH